jgi:hypothetical protein
MVRVSLKRVHLLWGIVGIGAFLLTGQYMDRSLDHLVGMADGPRALYRSGHIYILFSALLNLSLGLYMTKAKATIDRTLQTIGSGLVLGSLVLFLYSFAVETPLGQVERPMAREAIMWSLGGVLAHGIARTLTAARGELEQDIGRPTPVDAEHSGGGVTERSPEPALEARKLTSTGGEGNVL